MKHFYQLIRIMGIGMVTILYSACVTTDDVQNEELLTDIIRICPAQNSRASVEEINKEGMTMGVYAWKTYNELDYYPVFENQQMVYASGKWAYTPFKYWDTGTWYHFSAYSPFLKPDQISYGIRGNYTIRDFTVNQTDNDLMIAASKEIHGADKPLIRFEFEHILANVRVQFRQQNWDDAVRIDTLLITGMYVNGDYSGANNKSWSVSGDLHKGNYGLKNTSLHLPVDGSSVSYLDDHLMIPQEINEDICFLFVYHHRGLRYQREIYLKKSGLMTSWQRGKRTIYSFNITPEYISFDQPQIQPWVSGEGEDIIIIPK